MAVRLLATGHNKEGKATVLSDRRIEPVSIALAPGFETHELWSTRGERAVPHVGDLPGVPNYFPDRNGTVFRVAVIPPSADGLLATDLDMDAALAEAQAKLPGLIEHLEPGANGMHTTDSVDYGIVLEGEVCLELDDGVEVKLEAGACLVQNGTRHAWRNRSGKPCVMAFVLLGAERR